MKKILVTGGAGFIGSHLCERLINSGAHVTCVDDFSTGFRNNIAHLENNHDFTFIKHDMRIPLDLEVDEIYNLASPASPVHYQKNPVATVTTNVEGAINALDMARKNNAMILQASTSEIYGDPLVHPQNESYWGNVNPIGPRSCYDEGKRCAETLFFDYWRQYGVKIKVARIFNTYGPRMAIDDGRVVSNFIVQALKNSDITIFGDGRQTRSLCFVTDMADGLIKLMAANPSFTGPVNLGIPLEVEMGALARIIIKLAGSKSDLIFCPLPENDPKRRCPDISLARKELSWEPKISLDEGLITTIAYFKKVLGA